LDGRRRAASLGRLSDGHARPLDVRKCPPGLATSYAPCRRDRACRLGTRLGTLTEDLEERAAEIYADLMGRIATCDLPIKPAPVSALPAFH